MNEKFEYKYEAPTISERREIDSIRSQYLPKDKVTTKLERLKYLHNKVNNTSMVTALSLGVVGLLLFGTAMTFFLEWINYWYIGIPFAIIGVIMMGLAYPIYLKILKVLKEKYGKEIIELSNELLSEGK